MITPVLGGDCNVTNLERYSIHLCGTRCRLAKDFGTHNVMNFRQLKYCCVKYFLDRLVKEKYFLKILILALCSKPNNF